MGRSRTIFQKNTTDFCENRENDYKSATRPLLFYIADVRMRKNKRERVFMAIQESGEMYLETILILSKKQGMVRSMDVAAYMNFSKPSISRAVGILKKDGYVNMEKDGALTLTDAGRAIAERIYARHVMLTNFLTALGVDPAVASEDACKMEHDISEETFEALKRHAAAL